MEKAGVGSQRLGGFRSSRCWKVVFTWGGMYNYLVSGYLSERLKFKSRSLQQKSEFEAWVVVEDRSDSK